MKVTWLTQSGFLFENSKIKIMIDPYLSNAAGDVTPRKMRRIPADESYYREEPDVILITHAHVDHCDLFTLMRLLKTKKKITILAPEGAYHRILQMDSHHNVVLVSPHTVWSERGVTFYSLHAEHDDRTAVGFIIDDGEKTYYHSGDTLYNYDTIDDVLDLVEDGVDYAFLPICGHSNNMNAKDAADFAYEIGAHHAIPMSYGTVDDVTPDGFDFEDKIILEPFKEIEL